MDFFNELNIFKHAFERQTRRACPPQAGSRIYVWWSLTRFTWNVERYRDVSMCFELLRAARVPGGPRVFKKNRKEKKDNAI
ncbi:hypothetical protein AYP97_06425 [Lactobacillus crispatus]|nr:hypothetical protein AYP97_06425 [Lactobacillus crispatus]OXC51046.1 hypothetical protein AYP99_03255 [Lactobacillus crispatus]